MTSCIDFNMMFVPFCYSIKMHLDVFWVFLSIVMQMIGLFYFNFYSLADVRFFKIQHLILPIPFVLIVVAMLLRLVYLDFYFGVFCYQTSL